MDGIGGSPIADHYFIKTQYLINYGHAFFPFWHLLGGEVLLGCLC